MQLHLDTQLTPYQPFGQASAQFGPWNPRGHEQVPDTGSHDPGQMHLMEQSKLGVLLVRKREHFSPSKAKKPYTYIFL